MNKSDLVDVVAGKADMSKAEAGRAVDAVLDGISGALGSGDSVALVGFGTFSVRKRAARMGRNPQTGATESPLLSAPEMPSKTASTACDA